MDTKCSTSALIMPILKGTIMNVMVTIVMFLVHALCIALHEAAYVYFSAYTGILWSSPRLPEMLSVCSGPMSFSIIRAAGLFICVLFRSLRTLCSTSISCLHFPGLVAEVHCLPSSPASSDGFHPAPTETPVRQGANCPAPGWPQK